MIPRVKCRAPTGLTAFRGMGVERVAFGWITSEVKREMEAWSEGREEWVTRGMQRKWVNWGFGGISKCIRVPLMARLQALDRHVEVELDSTRKENGDIKIADLELVLIGYAPRS